MDEQINIFSKYAPADIAVMCANQSISRTHAQDMISAWRSLAAADGMFREIVDAAVIPSRSYHSQLERENMDYGQMMTKAYRSIYPLYEWIVKDPDQGGPDWHPQGLAFAYVQLLLKALGPLDLLTPEIASDDLFSQFSAEDIAYAAVLKGLDYKEAIRVWGDIVADQIEETPRNSLHSLGSLLDTFRLEINLKEGIAKEVALYFLKHLGLIK